MSFVYKRYAQALEPSSLPTVDPSYVSAGPEAAPTLAVTQAVASPTLTTQSSLSIGGMSTATLASLGSLLSFFGLLILVLVIWKVRGWRGNSDASDESVENDDVEAQTPTRPAIPVAPQAGVRWQPQIRSISGPAPRETEKRAPLPKRARSPPPTRTYHTKNQDPFADPYPKSAPASAVSFSDDVLRLPQKGGEMMSPPVSPHALAVSGMQTRSLARPSQISKNVDA